MSIIKKIEIFVPARALEHPNNPEKASRDDKIRMAVLRHYQKNVFTALLEVQDPIPWINLHKITFDKKNLGYSVLASIETYQNRPIVVDKGVNNQLV